MVSSVARTALRGGMPPTTLAPWLKPLSGRRLSFPEREELAILHAQAWRARRHGGAGDRPPARAGGIDDLA